MKKPKIKKNSHQLNVAGIRKRITLEEPQEKIFKKMQDVLGYTKEELVEAALKNHQHITIRRELGIDIESFISEGNHFFVDQTIILKEPRLVANKDIQEAFSYGDGKIAADATQITINLALTSFSKKDDPIDKLLRELSKTLNISIQEILKNWYLSFLRINEIVGENDYIIDMTALLNRYEYLVIWCSGDPELEMHRAKGNVINFSYLKSGKDKRLSPVTITLTDDIGNLIIQTLPLICKKLTRNRSSFFKILIMSQLRELNLLDGDNSIVKGWKTRISEIKYYYELE